MLGRPAPPPDRTLRYGDHPDQVVDLRLPPPAAAPRPLLVIVHGGFWRAEYDRTHTGPMAAALAAGGWCVAQLEYRRTGAPGGGWPGTLADVAAGLTMLPGLVAEAVPQHPPGDPPGWPPVMVGHSAGGQLALWWAGRGEVRAVVALAPVADLVDAHRRDLDGGAVSALLGGAPPEVPHRYAYAQPRPAGRMTVIHGARDEQVPVAMSRAWVAGTDVDYHELPEAEHFGLIDPESDAWPVVTWALERSILP